MADKFFIKSGYGFTKYESKFDSLDELVEHWLQTKFYSIGLKNELEELSKKIGIPLIAVYAKMPEDVNFDYFTKVTKLKEWYKPFLLMKNDNGQPVTFTEEEADKMVKYLNEESGYTRNIANAKPYWGGEGQPL